MKNPNYFCDITRHLVCIPYTVDNLHRMAQDLKISRCWYRTGNGRHPHYDIPKSRIAEIHTKCHLVSDRTILSITKGNLIVI